MASPTSQSSSSSTTSHRRLLVPSFLVPTPQRHTQHRTTRPRSDSASHPIQAPLRTQWPFTEFKLHVVHNNIVLHGYRICAVEKWYVSYSILSLNLNTVFVRIIQRAHCTFLIVYTGDQTDKVCPPLSRHIFRGCLPSQDHCSRYNPSSIPFLRGAVINMG